MIGLTFLGELGWHIVFGVVGFCAGVFLTHQWMKKRPK